jgi:hypothetical protein
MREHISGDSFLMEEGDTYPIPTFVFTTPFPAGNVTRATQGVPDCFAQSASAFAVDDTAEGQPG